MTPSTTDQPNAPRTPRLIQILAIIALITLITGLAVLAWLNINAGESEPQANQSAFPSSVATEEIPPAPSIPAAPTPTGAAGEPGDEESTQNECNQDKILADLSTISPVPNTFDFTAFCDGQWAVAGTKNRDDIVLAHYVDGTWQVQHNPCAPEVPTAHQGRFAECFMTPPPAPPVELPLSAPDCDGRGVLIVHSVVAAGGVDTSAELGRTLSQYPGAQVMIPGQCPSVRGDIDGNAIYPVYLDFGQDRAGLCSAKATYGGEARTLNVQGDFKDPC